MSLGTTNRDGGKTSESGHLRALGKTVTGDVIAGLAASQRAAGVNMSVDISIGDAFVRRSDGSYSHPVFNDAVYNQVISAADGSNPRRDIVVIYVDYAETPSTAVSNNTNGVVKIKVVNGTPAGSPVDPNDAAIQSSVGSGNPFTKLARVRVPAGQTSISNSLIDDLRSMVTPVRQQSSVEAMQGETIPFLSSGTWTKKAGLKYIIVELQAGGGAGGRAGATAGTSGSESNGGGGGEYALKKILAASLGDTETVTIGAGGAPGSPAGAGGNTSFGSHFTANGGAGGTAMPADTGAAYIPPAAGGSGGAGTADLRIPGGPGGAGATNGTTSFGIGRMNYGGASRFSPQTTSGGTTNAAGVAAGANSGGGGSGARNTASQSLKEGGAGGSGRAIVTEFY